MSWHHSDYINLISSVGGVSSATIALIATLNALRIQKNARIREIAKDEEENRINLFIRIDSMVMSLARIANDCVGNNFKIINNVGSLIEFTSAINTAYEIVEESGLKDDDKRIIRFSFEHILRPAIRYELEKIEAFLMVDGNKIDELKDNYLKAIKNLVLTHKSLLTIQATD